MFDPIPPKQLLKAFIRQLIITGVLCIIAYIVAFKII